MAKYGTFYYNTSKYGIEPVRSFSVEPMVITVLDFTRVRIDWVNPSGTYTKVRLVRNQIGFPETAEDGVIVWEVLGLTDKDFFIDGEENPLSTPIISGRPIYYSMFLFNASNVWTRAGNISDIVPSDHNSTFKLVDLLPKVFTSDIKSPLGVIDTNSELYKFLSGFAFTLDELLTEIDLLRPRHNEDISSYLLLPTEFFSLGFIPESGISIKNQKILLRELLYIYSKRGLKSGVETYSEALTGYAPTITVSPNDLLTVQDSTFYKSTGNWLVSNCTLTASTAQVPPTNTYTIDTEYTGEVVASGAASITLGADAPVTKGIPVLENTPYTFSVKHKSPLSAGNVKLTVNWYDRTGTKLNSNYVSSSISSTNTWKTLWDSTTSPAGASYASLKIDFSAAGTYYVDQIYVESDYNPLNTSYKEARAVDIFLSPNKTNFIKNPSFETNATDNWTASDCTPTQSTSIPTNTYTGIRSATFSPTGSWTFTSNTFPITAGTYYTASFYAKASTSMTVRLIARNSVGTIVGTATSLSTGVVADWTRFTLTDLEDALSFAATYELTFSGNAGTFFLDSVQAEKGTTATDYFDGNLPLDFGAVWESTANNSFSHIYVGKPFKVPRLADTLEEILPPNAFWTLRTYAGLEYTNLS